MNVLLLLFVTAAQSPDGGSLGDPTPPSELSDAALSEVQSSDTVLESAPAAGPPTTSPVDGRLRGRVLAKGSRGPVPGAKIAASSGATQVAAGETSDDGQFDLAIPCGPHDIAIRAPGFEPMTFERDACVDEAPLPLRLVPRPNLPVYETVVEAPTDEPRIALQGPELTTTPGALGDPLRTIESLPGVAAVAWPAPIYAIRGSNPGNTGYFLDDVQVPMLFHLALGPAVINPSFFESMAFYPGGYPVSYGRYVAGMVAAQTRAPANDRAHASAEVRLYDAGALVSAPWPDRNGGVAAAFRYSYTGALLSLLRNDVRLSYWDYQLRADRRVSSWRLSLLLFGSSDDLAYRLESSQPEREYFMQFHRATVHASAPLGRGQLIGRLSLGTDHSTAPIVRDFPISADGYSIAPRIAYQRPAAAVDWEVGLDGQAQWFRPVNNLPGAGASDLGSKRAALLAGGYVSAGIRAGSRLTLTPGLRFDSYTISGVTRSDLGPRLSGRLRLDSSTWLVASGGRYSQPPSLTIQIPAAESFGLGLYGLQTSWQGSLGLGTERLRAVEIEVTGYVQRYVLTDLRDPTLVNPDPLAGDFLVRRDARSYGLEVMIRRPESERLHGWLSYTLSQNQRALGAGVIGPSDWDQRHILNAVLGYRLGRTTLGARGHLNTGRPVLVSGDQAETFVRLPTFYQLDLRAERAILLPSFTLHVYLELVNATLTRAVLGLEQDAQTKQISQTSYRVILPSLGIRGEL